MRRQPFPCPSCTYLQEEIQVLKLDTNTLTDKQADRDKSLNQTQKKIDLSVCPIFSPISHCSILSPYIIIDSVEIFQTIFEGSMINLQEHFSRHTNRQTDQQLYF